METYRSERTRHTGAMLSKGAFAVVLQFTLSHTCGMNRCIAWVQILLQIQLPVSRASEGDSVLKITYVIKLDAKGLNKIPGGNLSVLQNDENDIFPISAVKRTSRWIHIDGLRSLSLLIRGDARKISHHPGLRCRTSTKSGLLVDDAIHEVRLVLVLPPPHLQQPRWRCGDNGMMHATLPVTAARAMFLICGGQLPDVDKLLANNSR
ncbi:unnamed protein product, partial [Iphiclides podalirius]